MSDDRTASENAEVSALLTRLAEAWNAGDAAAYAAVFTEDADYISFDGAHSQGRESIESSHRWLFEGPLKGSTMSAPAGTRFKRLADGAVLVISAGGTAVDGRQRDSTVSFTAVRTPEGWRLASFQNTRVSPR
ncbi:SgcJ/EcaC family oxidoreductase [Nonomuraea candida]|uniref:SgcJ/EcaC family oxidoreductase n=1 Tax=Nonomuraea candida TaxID=359159 RepID=UPI0005BA3B91|nr:SgcJ/EcaC family oxidoreductase [Nonomuraea candida]